MMPANADCPLCDGHGETVLYRNAFLRVINAQDPDYPAFTRVILNRHVQEMTDLNQGRTSWPDERSLSGRSPATPPFPARQN